MNSYNNNKNELIKNEFFVYKNAHRQFTQEDIDHISECDYLR